MIVTIKEIKRDRKKWGEYNTPVSYYLNVEHYTKMPVSKKLSHAGTE